MNKKYTTVKDHYAIIFDEEGKPILHIVKDELELNEYLEDVVNSLANQFLDPNSPKFIYKDV